MTLASFAAKCEQVLALHRGGDWRVAGRYPEMWVELSGCRVDPVFDCGWVRYRIGDGWTLERQPVWEAAKFGLTRKRLRTHRHCAEPGCGRFSDGWYCETHRA